MGAWGTGLYSNDTACDIRGDYLDQLKRGKTNEEITRKLVEDNAESMDDPEDAPLFWFALADTQWNYGRLLPEVLEKALYYLKQDGDLEVWAEAGEKKLNAWKATRRKLEEKLNTPQPPEKKVYKYRFYECKWKLGDVYAYRFTSEFSKEKGFYGKYVVMRKISTVFSWPGDIIPVVNVYKKVWEELPGLNDIVDIPLLEMSYYKLDLARELSEKEYRIELMSTSQRVIPKENLTYIGNLPGDDFIPHNAPGCFSGFYAGWEKSSYNEKFEHVMINMFELWK